MSKQPTARQVETVSRELTRAIESVVEAWRFHYPYPTWQEDEEWRRTNPSPRDQHRRIEEEFRSTVKAKADVLLLRVKLGDIPSELVFTELALILESLQEERLKLLHAGA